MHLGSPVPARDCSADHVRRIPRTPFGLSRFRLTQQSSSLADFHTPCQPRQATGLQLQPSYDRLFESTAEDAEPPACSQQTCSIRGSCLWFASLSLVRFTVSGSLHDARLMTNQPAETCTRSLPAGSETASSPAEDDGTKEKKSQVPSVFPLRLTSSSIDNRMA